MKIGEDKIVQGIYKYDSEITYTKGDFVIGSDNMIYTVLKEVTGLDPSSLFPDYFKLYNSTELATYEDFVDMVNGNASSESLQKSVSLGTLRKILNAQSSGLDFEGIITNRVINDSITFTDYFGNDTKSIYTDNPLDVILEYPDLNSAYFKIDKTIMQKIIGTKETPPINGILRQLTYLDTTTAGLESILIRIQELIEPSSGLVLYRYSISPDGETFEKLSTSTWRGQCKVYSSGTQDGNEGSSTSNVLGSSQNPDNNAPMSASNAYLNIVKNLDEYYERLKS
jgi:hypothetical protein